MRSITNLALLILGLSLPACTLLKEKEQPSAVDSAIQRPLPPEKTQELLGEVGENFLYGEGLGDTAITAGTIIAFPPYAIWVAGNGLLSISGYEPLRVTDALPEEGQTAWDDAYSSVSSGPGKVAAAIAGKEFRSKEVAAEKLKPYLSYAQESQNEVGSAAPTENEQAGQKEE
ncbi:MAG: hypothetical protein DCC75_01925 [Proteobacteria bacterium]|nr:MAG: hypothetical protein DCC75_01925 [Pseudomonadota bacterium]